MKKNNLKDPNQFKYEPRRQQKQPLWMHTSVQMHRTSRTTLGEVLIIVAIFAALALTWSILG